MSQDHKTKRRRSVFWSGLVLLALAPLLWFMRGNSMQPAAEIKPQDLHGGATGTATEPGAAAAPEAGMGAKAGHPAPGDPGAATKGPADDKGDSEVVIAKTKFGSGPHELGLNEETAPTGPAAIVPLGDSQALVIDQFNDRVVKVGSGSSSTAFPLGGFFATDAVHLPNGDLALLDAYQTRTVLRVSPEGSEIARWKVALPGDEPRRLYTNLNGDIFVGGMDGTFRIGPDGALAPVPGVPAYSNPGEFFKTRKVATDKFELNVLDGQGQTLNHLDLNRHFDAIHGVGSDAAGFVYILFDREVGAEGDPAGAGAQIEVQVFNVKTGSMVKVLTFEDHNYAEVEHDLVVSPEGEVWRLVSDAQSISLVKGRPKATAASAP